MITGSDDAPGRVPHPAVGSRFFIPREDGPEAERIYQELRRTVESKMGRPPTSRRIMELWTRRGNLDCVTVVGSPDPVAGGTVTAIFDMGLRQPFVVVHQHGAHPDSRSCSVLGCGAYSVTEFSP